MNHHSRSLSVGLFLVGLAFSTAALADKTTTGKIGKLQVLTTFSYDQLELQGDVDLCTSSDVSSSTWRKKIKIDRTDGGYEASMKILLSAQLAGKDVSVTGEPRGTGSDARCYLKDVRIL